MPQPHSLQHAIEMKRVIKGKFVYAAFSRSAFESFKLLECVSVRVCVCRQSAGNSHSSGRNQLNLQNTPCHTIKCHSLLNANDYLKSSTLTKQNMGISARTRTAPTFTRVQHSK